MLRGQRWLMSRQLLNRGLGTGLAMLLFVAGVVAQQPHPSTTDAKTKAPAKRAIRPEDYGAWESLGLAALSPDGRWLAYSIARPDGEGELRLRMLATQATEAVPHGARPQFSKDGKWLAYTIGVSEAEREKAAKTKEAVKSKLGLRNLVSGELAHHRRRGDRGVQRQRQVPGHATVPDQGARERRRRYRRPQPRQRRRHQFRQRRQLRVQRPRIAPGPGDRRRRESRQRHPGL